MRVLRATGAVLLLLQYLLQSCSRGGGAKIGVVLSFVKKRFVYHPHRGGQIPVRYRTICFHGKRSEKSRLPFFRYRISFLKPSKKNAGIHSTLYVESTAHCIFFFHVVRAACSRGFIQNSCVSVHRGGEGLVVPGGGCVARGECGAGRCRRCHPRPRAQFASADHRMTP